MSRGSWFCEAQCVVFYEVWRLLGAPDSGDLGAGWVRLKNLARARLQVLETLEARSDERLKHCPWEVKLVVFSESRKLLGVPDSYGVNGPGASA